jgi:hypothetical protein
MNVCGADPACLNQCGGNSELPLSSQCFAALLGLYQCADGSGCLSELNPQQCLYMHCRTQWEAVFGSAQPVDCVDGSTQSCGTDVGTCQPGIRTCEGGLWGACVGAVNPVAEICNGIDDDCDGTVDDNPTGDTAHTYFRDYDGDGFGNPSETMQACSPSAPSGYAANDSDCFDRNPEAHPGQSAFFDGHRGDGSFDYDCDGQETLEWDSFGACDIICDVTEGWLGTVPACGSSGDWLAYCGIAITGCTESTARQQQGCR